MPRPRAATDETGCVAELHSRAEAARRTLAYMASVTAVTREMAGSSDPDAMRERRAARPPRDERADRVARGAGELTRKLVFPRRGGSAPGEVVAVKRADRDRLVTSAA